MSERDHAARPPAERRTAYGAGTAGPTAPTYSDRAGRPSAGPRASAACC